jgi:hypothetical protein
MVRHALVAVVALQLAAEALGATKITDGNYKAARDMWVTGSRNTAIATYGEIDKCQYWQPCVRIRIHIALWATGTCLALAL